VAKFLETLPLWLGFLGALAFVVSMAMQLWRAYT
jgi:hypothetical protein